MILRAFLIFASLTAGLAAESKTELGEINGAPFRIDMPESWNGGLVMFCHGHSATPSNDP